MSGDSFTNHDCNSAGQEHNPRSRTALARPGRTMHHGAEQMDRISPRIRSALMGQVRRANTKPEFVVRRLLHALGLRFRLHRPDLPGRPDIVLPRWKTVIFVHGCFWHRHRHCKRTTTPAANKAFWLRKFAQNQRRDRRNQKDLHDLGWRVLVVWECETAEPDRLRNRLTAELTSKP
jgi:DNA mismatch endonuclease (patch repair protein)